MPRTESQKRADRLRELRGRPGWKGTVTLSEQRHQILKQIMLPGETEQQTIIRLIEEKKMYTVTTYTKSGTIIPDMTTVTQGHNAAHLSQINPDLRGTSSMPDDVKNEYFDDYETAAEHARQFGYVPSWEQTEDDDAA